MEEGWFVNMKEQLIYFGSDTSFSSPAPLYDNSDCHSDHAVDLHFQPKTSQLLH